MTTLAIVGSGFLGRTLLYTLAKEQKSFEKITLLHSDVMAFPCSLHSTAIVAPRGLTYGHSPLGDYLLDGFLEFKKHVEENHPAGVWEIPQYNGATSKLDNFKQRYPQGTTLKRLPGLALTSEIYFAEEKAFMLDPATYCSWLLEEAKKHLVCELEIISDFVTEVQIQENILIKTLSGKSLFFNKLVFTGGNYNRFWKELVPDSVLKTSRPVQGSYLEFNQIHLGLPSFSLTLDGDNLIWNHYLGRLIIGATSEEVGHVLPDMHELRKIYQRISQAVELKLPPYEEGIIKTGLREKARKRVPYTIGETNLFFLGGMYKNGCSLPVKMTKDFSRQYL